MVEVFEEEVEEEERQLTPVDFKLIRARIEVRFSTDSARIEVRLSPDLSVHSAWIEHGLRARMRVRLSTD